MKVIQTILIIALFQGIAHSQDTLYHACHQSASDWNIDVWNIESPNEAVMILKEITDSNNRVVQMEFLKDGEQYSPLCYMATKIKFEYYKDSIIELLYFKDEPVLATDCEGWYRSAYHLDSAGFIQSVTRYSKYDYAQMEPEEIEKWKKWAPLVRRKTSEETPLYIHYFFYSYAKMNGSFPRSRIFYTENELRENFMGRVTELTPIIEGLNKK